MNSKEQEFVDGLNGKSYVRVINVNNPRTLKISERMTYEDAMKKYNQMIYQFDHGKPMLGQLMYVARYSEPYKELEGTHKIVI